MWFLHMCACMGFLKGHGLNGEVPSPGWLLCLCLYAMNKLRDKNLLLKKVFDRKNG